MSAPIKRCSGSTAPLGIFAIKPGKGPFSTKMWSTEGAVAIYIYIYTHTYMRAVKLGSAPRLTLLKVRFWTNLKFRFWTKIILAYFYCGFKQTFYSKEKVSVLRLWGLQPVIGHVCKNGLFWQW